MFLRLVGEQEDRRKRKEDKEKAMGKSLCCDKAGIKKGPWTPEEDIILVSYIQKNGPGNWRSVPANTGLMRCSKSCRLRWTNYLRPGIKRGNFTQHEEGLIIHLQSMLGNKWAAIASYLPQRTDNDIKNYWNTHLKKKIKKYQPAINSFSASSDPSSICNELVSRFYSADNTNLYSTLPMPNQISSSTYASSTENISRLLEGWTRSSQKAGSTPVVKNDQEGYNSASNEELKSLLPFEDPSNIAWEDSSSEPTLYGFQSIPIRCDGNQKSDQTQNLPLTVLDNWLLDDEVVGHVDLSCPDGIY